MEYESDCGNNCKMHSEQFQKLGKGVGRLGNKRSREHPYDSIIKIGQYTEKCPGVLRRLSRKHQ